MPARTAAGGMTQPSRKRKDPGSPLRQAATVVGTSANMARGQISVKRESQRRDGMRETAA